MKHIQCCIIFPDISQGKSQGKSQGVDWKNWTGPRLKNNQKAMKLNQNELILLLFARLFEYFWIRTIEFQNRI